MRRGYPTVVVSGCWLRATAWQQIWFGRGGGRERQRTGAATCGFAQADRLVSNVMSAPAGWPK